MPPEQPEQPEQLERPEQPERPERPEQPEQPEQPPDFGPTDDPAGAVRDLLAIAAPSERVRLLMETGAHDADLWNRLAGAGILGLHLPVGAGGGGQSWVELGAVLEEMGAALACSPFLSTVAIASTVIARSGDVEAAATLLPDIAAGRLLVAVAVAEDDRRWDTDAITTTATFTASEGNQGAAPGGTDAPGGGGGGGWRLDGHKSFVVDGAIADQVLVAAVGPDGPGLFLVDAGAPGLTRMPLAPVDQTRGQCRLELDGVPARRLRGGDVPNLVDIASVALACESVGGARRCLEMAVAHASRRVQFGRPIGSFQAVAHRCAEMLVDLECARASAREAARVLAGSKSQAALAIAAPAAKVAATEAFARAAAANIQIHGGTGFTWDCDAHLFFKRARSSQLLFGDPRYHREALASRLGW